MSNMHAPRSARGNPPPIALADTAAPFEAGPGRRRKARYICPACGEHLIYRERRCASCNEESPVYNLPVFWRWFYTILLLGVGFAAYQIVT